MLFFTRILKIFVKKRKSRPEGWLSHVAPALTILPQIEKKGAYKSRVTQNYQNVNEM